MMTRHNRKSYLATPAPRALNRDGSRDSFINPLPTLQSLNNSTSNHNTPSAGPESGSSGDTHSTRTIPTPTSASGDIPLIATQSPPPSSVPTGTAARSPPPPLSLEHLNLETQNQCMPNSHGSRSNRRGFSNRDNIPESASAIEPASRPMFPRMNSANGHSAGAGSTPRNGLQSATMPRRTAPPPTGPPSGPLPPPPEREGMSDRFGSPRRQR
jgi:mitogen-activated protein kinase kinase